jgi:hypothetical protein
LSGTKACRNPLKGPVVELLIHHAENFKIA